MMLCGVVLRGVMLCGVVFCEVVLCGVVLCCVEAGVNVEWYGGEFCRVA